MRTILSLLAMTVSVNAMAFGVSFPPSTMNNDLDKMNAIRGVKQMAPEDFGKKTNAKYIQKGVYKVYNKKTGCEVVVSVSGTKPVVVTPETAISCD